MRVATAAQLVLYGILTSAKDIVIPAVPKKKITNVWAHLFT